IFEAQAQSLDETQSLVVAGSGNLAEAVRTAIRGIDRTAVFTDLATVEQKLTQQQAPRRFPAGVLTLFAGLALALAGAGIFGMMHYSVAQRTREIGVRMALGARRGNVLTMVLSEGVILAAAGVALGIAGARAASSALSSMLFGVTPED